jgi:hypothetical protein
MSEGKQKSHQGIGDRASYQNLLLLEMCKFAEMMGIKKTSNLRTFMLALKQMPYTFSLHFQRKT